LCGGSANEGLGVTEYYNTVMSAGTYYFAVSGYEGTGYMHLHIIRVQKM